MTVVPFSLYGQQTSIRLPTSRVSKGGASVYCRASQRSEMPSASRRSRAASALALRLLRLNKLVAYSASASGSAVPRVLITWELSCGGAASAGSCFRRRSALSCGRMSSSSIERSFSMV